MKRILYILVFSSLVLSCAKDETIPEYGNYTLTGFANTNNNTKTYFGTPDEDSQTIPFLWSEGDKIWCGNSTSTGVTISQDGKSAEFMLESEPQDGSIVYYNMNGSSSVSSYIPASQSISNSLGLNGDFGYGTISDGSFTLTHATSYLWFKVQGLPESSVLKSITLYVAGSNIAGNAVWSGSSFTMPQLVTDNIELKVNASDLNDKNLVMVVYPVRMENPVVKYEVVKDDIITVYEHNLTTNNIASGNTYIITSDLSALSNYNLRVLTFEDKDTKFSEYALDYCSVTISKWSDLIDEEQHNGVMLYNNGSGSGAEYYWNDDKNTFLSHMFPAPEAYGYNQCYFGGGLAISNYDEISTDIIGDIVAENPYNTLAPYVHQLSIPLNGGKSGSNFCVGYCASEVSHEGMDHPTLEFSNGECMIVDHLYVTNTSITLYAIENGYFTNTAYGPEDFLKIVAAGYDVNDELTGTSEFYLAKGDEFVTDWVKWDLHSLGAVSRIKFYLVENQISEYYGMQYYNSPLYFALDDIAVRFDE